MHIWKFVFLFYVNNNHRFLKKKYNNINKSSVVIYFRALNKPKKNKKENKRENTKKIEKLILEENI
jgi:alpha-acetolactate decarboxylase